MPEGSALYVDNVPTPVTAKSADAQVAERTKEARKAQWEADTLSLARDVAMLGSLYKEVSKTEAAKRAEKVLHLKNQNTIGMALMGDYMNTNMSVQSAQPKEQLSLMDRAGQPENSLTEMTAERLKQGRG